MRIALDALLCMSSAKNIRADFLTEHTHRTLAAHLLMRLSLSEFELKYEMLTQTGGSGNVCVLQAAMLYNVTKRLLFDLCHAAPILH